MVAAAGVAGGEKRATPPPAGTPRRVHGALTLPGKASAVIGIRRTGKTTFLHQVPRERIGAGVPQDRLPYINFEDERLAGIETRHLGLLVEEYYRRFPALRGQAAVTWCFHEMQVVTGWERFVRRLLDTERVEVFLGGSSAALLSREVAIGMRGRGWEVVIHPFSFEEFLRHHSHGVPEQPDRVTPAERSALEHELLRYLDIGGFPEAQPLGPADRHEPLLRHVDVAMLRDGMERHGVTHVLGLKWLVRHLLGNPGTLFSVEKFYARLKAQGLAISRGTLHALQGYVEDCSLVRTVWVEATSERRRMVNPRKVYPVDPGVIPIFDQSGRANRGHALETVVCIELKRQRFQLTYVRTRDGLEVDFLARRPGQRPLLVQAAAELEDRATQEREVRALLAAQAEHPRASLHLVTLTPESPEGIPETVRVFPAWQWLLAGPESEE